MSRQNDDKSIKKFNSLCTRCLRPCKQPVTCLLVDCPRYYPLPFKVEKHSYQQLNLFEEKKKK